SLSIKNNLVQRFEIRFCFNFSTTDHKSAVPVKAEVKFGMKNVGYPRITALIYFASRRGGNVNGFKIDFLCRYASSYEQCGYQEIIESRLYDHKCVIF